MNEFVNSSAEYVEFFLAIAGAVGVVVAFIRWGQRSLEHKILEQIKESTKPIQPNTNGGKSLSDLHVKVDAIIHRVERLERGQNEGVS